MKVTAVVIDGFHAGHTVRMEYSPTLKLLKPLVIRVDYCCDPDTKFNEPIDYLEYKECFRSVDRRMVLYSEKGESMDMLGKFPMTYSERPWNPNTILYMGYHNEPIIREDTPTPITNEDNLK